jgi:serralysin
MAAVLLTIAAVDVGTQGRPTTAPGRSGDRRQDVERRRDENDARIALDAPLPLNVVAPSGDVRIDALMSGYQWSGSTVTYSFYEDDVFAGAYYGSETVSEVSEAVKTNVRAIMAWYSALINVNFVEVTETSTSAIGTIRIMRSTAPSYAYAYYPTSSSPTSVAGDVHLQVSYDRLVDTNGFQQPAGEHGYTALIHEIGHAIGLKHPHSGTPTLPTDIDSHTTTVMSYQFPGESPGTPMGFDTMALQYIYGARAKNTGNDSYQMSRAAVDQYALGAQLFLNPSLATKQALWDSGGYNVLDLSTVAPGSTGYRLDLRPLGWLSTNANYRTTTVNNIAVPYLHAGSVVGPGVAIHALVNSAGNDTVYANGQANVFRGYAPGRVTGVDVINGASPADTVDLSGYTSGAVTQTPSGSDLVLGLGTNGSIRLVNYFGGDTPSILFAGAGSLSRVSIGDVSVVEGTGGDRVATFGVTLTAPPIATETVQFSTSDGSALAGGDYVSASGVLTFAAGESTKTVLVSVVTDATQEPDETFSVTLSNPSAGLELLDGMAVGTIQNDDLPPNAPPVANVTATPTSGIVPLAVAFTGSGSTDSDGTIVGYAWTFGDGGTSSAMNPSHTYTAAGTYTAMLIVTDDRGATGSRSVLIDVQPDPTAVMFVGALTIEPVVSGNRRSARATVSVRRPDGQPVSGAAVSVRWSGLVSGNSTATTDASGVAVMSSKTSRRGGTITVQVTGVSKAGFTYDPSRNAASSGSVAVP